MRRYIFYYLFAIIILNLFKYTYGCSPNTYGSSYSSGQTGGSTYTTSYNSYQSDVPTANINNGFQTQQASYQAPASYGVASSGFKARSEIKKLKKCIRDDFGSYSASELKSLATFYPFNKDPNKIPSLLLDGHASCDFSNFKEKCSWHSEIGGKNSFRIARYESLFDLNKFDCTSNRDFNFEDYFLFGSVFKEEGGNIMARFINLDLDVPCQYGKATLSFEYWCNNESAQLEVCVVIKENSVEVCEPAAIDENPLTFEMPENLRPFTIRLHIKNINENNVILIDKIKYDAQLCENVEEGEDMSISNSNETLIGIHGNEIDDNPTQSPEKVRYVVDDGHIVKDEKVETSFVTEDYNEVMDGNVEDNSDATPLSGKEKETLCGLLRCNFNDNSTCNYNPFSDLATRPWQLSSVGVGNPLTGIHKTDPNDNVKGGYFLFAGHDIEPNDGNDVYILESPIFKSDDDFYILFDIYQRSVGVNFLICLDTFENCPYKNPPVNKNRYWFTKERLLIEKATTKIYFVIDLIDPHQYFALDNIQLETFTANGYEDYCPKRRQT
uniref:MAM domain-containing protein n=1 Tax=Parastrongyloides trichosuri TaxID=131310 RepID=A0A0N5A2Z7_PARTI